ncbi:conserved hypothetical protein [Theileria equi strain WA]|uniref:K Homology domain-containing protein n=1 Tax=Theileria equi strain WA TaxID=1537102 RepID=L1LA18_THEEQ|nr:conserved hypothetical protein [Theileria equi strain WA]EKX72008.1 conserved hypothetical protein [Theileria equi strain WA]|eukprot:XP_004831460.1 conserved hypothetical protein [Theileria equi strain WA]
MSIEDFRGATKRNKPELNEGDVIFCQVTRHYPRYEMPTEVSCIDADSVKQWTTNECYFGQLMDGVTFDVPITYAVSLSRDKCYILKKCASKLKFEIAVGLNGRVWVKGSNIQETLLVARFIKRSYGCSVAQIEALFTKLFS